MGEKMQYSPSPPSSKCIGEASQACFSGFCARPSFLSLPYNDSSQAHHLPKTPTSSTSVTNTSSSSQYNFIVSTLGSLHPNITHFTNHESLPSLHESFAYFTKSFPKFSHTQQADQIRSREYCHLALSSHVCLDYVGVGLFSHSSKAQPNTTCYTNDSSPSSPSSSTHHSFDHLPESSFFGMSYKAVSLKSQLLHGSQESELELKMRKRIMDFMNVSGEDYTMAFTSNQSSAFKLIAESYPFQSNRNLLTVYDYNNEALDIMIESSKKKGAKVLCAEFSWPSMRVQSRKLRKTIKSSTTSSSTSNKKVRPNKGLFVFPLQSRMTGSRYSYQWMSFARENGWHVLLDACALGPKDMETLGLSFFKPDFLICSFYKVFGENPSGFGCLFVKKSSSSILTSSTTSTSIGIVSLVSPSILTVSNFEDKESFDQTSTLDESPNRDDSNDKDQGQSSEIVELETNVTRSEKSSNSSTIVECNGLDHADSLGLVMISARSRYLINWLVNALTRLQHPYSENGNPLIRIYGPNIGFDRGRSLAFNVFDWKGEKIDPILVQKLADRNKISLGCGFLEHVSFVDKSEEDRERRVETCVVTTTTRRQSDHGYEVLGNVALDMERENRRQCGISAITVTLGLVTNFEDIYRLWAFVARFLDADFVEKERWRYLALNQTTIEV